eukprot:gene6552-6780_t
MLEKQVQLRIEAFRAAANGLSGTHSQQQENDQRLLELLKEHTMAAEDSLKAAQQRQRLLQEAEVLYKELQQLPQLAQLPENFAGEHFSLPHPNPTRAQRAKQAHALAVAEARIGSRWWLPLKCLNQQQHDAATGGSHTSLEREWQQQDQVWRSTWDKIKAGHLQNTLAVAHHQAKLVQQQRVERELEAELSSESSWIKCEDS